MTRFDETNYQGQGNLSGAKDDAKATAARASEHAKQQAKGQLEKGRDTASAGLEKVAHAVQAAASDLSEQNQQGLSRYVTEIADSMSSLAESLRGKNVDDLVHEVSDLAKRNPTLFIAGSVAIGLGLARFAKASRNDEATQSDRGAGYGAYASSSEEQFESEWPASFSDTDYDAEYSGGISDFASKEEETIKGDALAPSDNNNPNTVGGRRYE